MMNEEEYERPNKRVRRASEQEIKELLLNSASKRGDIEDVIYDISFTLKDKFSSHLKMIGTINDAVNVDKTSTDGNIIYKFPDDCSSVLCLPVRPSKLCIERCCYFRLFDQIMHFWSCQPENIVVTGNSGIGTSWFQVYFLRRLLRECTSQHSPFRFVLRHVAVQDIYFFDLETRRCWSLTATDGKNVRSLVAELLEPLAKVLCLFEPGALREEGHPIMIPATPGLSTLSPSPNRIKECKKQARPLFLYVPLWNFDDLQMVLECEKKLQNYHMDDEDFDLEEQHKIFGGITGIRHTLEHNKLRINENRNDLDKRIQDITTEVLRSIHVGLDDNSDGPTQNNIGGYIAAYSDVPEEGKDAFTRKNLAMTSEYARMKIDEKFNLRGPQEHAKHLAECLDKRSSDVTGRDLEVSAAHSVACGPQAIKWNCVSVGANVENPLVTKLRHTKKEVMREDNIDKSKLNWPSDPSFSLVDFFMFINTECWAFQTTWQESHAFKLSTLWSFRQKIGASEKEKLNLLFVVPPGKRMTYAKQKKEKYLLTGETIKNPILNRKNGSVLLSVERVREMWDNAYVFVAYPTDGSERATKALLA